MKKQIKIYNTCKEAEDADRKRISTMSPEERMNEFGAIQARIWGDLWTDSKIQKKVSFGSLEWYK
jgi:hypothetical protein